MTRFATLPDATSPIRVALIGAGQMGRNWMRALSASPDVELCGIVDLDLPLARAAIEDLGLDGVAIAGSLAEITEATAIDAVINVTVPEAHHALNTEALFRGLPVLCEKPITPNVSGALSLAAAAEVTGQLLMTSQSRRYYSSLERFRDRVAELSPIGFLTTNFYRASHFGGFREEMRHPLLVDMAIHAFDVARFVLGLDPVSVYCEAFNPPWSWFDGSAAATAIFEFSGGTTYAYSGSWVSAGFETSWNGSWRASGADGSVLWDGEGEPTLESAVAGLVESSGFASSSSTIPSAPEEIAGSLAEFVHSLRTGDAPWGEVHSNVLSLAMVEGAVLSADTGVRVAIADILDAAYVQSLAVEKKPEVREVLRGWESARDILK